MEKQQTAVEYYSNRIGKLVAHLVTGRISGAQFVILEMRLEKQVKEMEKEQMCQFTYKCHNHYKVYGDFNIEQYYNETFNTNEK
jgi:hypothetical protein